MTPSFVGGKYDSCLTFFSSMVCVFACCSPNVFKRSTALSSSQFLVFSFVISSILSFIKMELGLSTDFGNRRMCSDISKYIYHKNILLLIDKLNKGGFYV